MEEPLEEIVPEVRVVDFGSVAIDASAEKILTFKNESNKHLTYRISHVYILDTIDRVFRVRISSAPVPPGDSARARIVFKPNIVGQCFTEYYIVDDTGGNTCRLTVTGKCFGPRVYLKPNTLVFDICRNVSDNRSQVIHIVNKSAVDTTYQWYMPADGQGGFQITSTCGLIRARETIATTVNFTGTSLGVYTTELVCLVLNQAPLHLNVQATVNLKGDRKYDWRDHSYEKYRRRRCPTTYFMDNSLTRLPYMPAASVFERYLQFSQGSIDDVTMNISQTLCVTNHERDDCRIEWMPDPEEVFLIDPTSCVIPSNESKLFTVRFRPKSNNEVYGYLMCGDFQYKVCTADEPKTMHSWFRIPCTGYTWQACAATVTEWDCPEEVVLPPTVPARTTFANFMLANKFDIPMHFKFQAPYGTNYVLSPMCGIVEGRGWQIITVALEPKALGDYCENWNIFINEVQEGHISFTGSAETANVEVMSHGYHPGTHALLEFPPTITGCTNYCTTYLHNLTRMPMHIRVLNSMPWLGADNSGSIVILPKEVLHYHWWFFPTVPDKVYETTVTCSCVCLIKDRPAGEPNEILIHFSGFSELPNLKVLPKTTNLHDLPVAECHLLPVTLYNFSSCFFTSKLFHTIDGMGDDFSGDRLEIESAINSLKPSNHCEVKLTVTPDGAGSRRLDLYYTVLYRTEYEEIEEIQPVKQQICTIWYDGVYPTIKVKRTISVECPIILSNHCVWNMVNVDELNKAFVKCRPHKPVSVTLYAPSLCVHTSDVVLVFVLGCVYSIPVPWNLRREKMCDCHLIEVKLGTSLYEMRHDCKHREFVEIFPLSGIVSPKHPNLLYIKFNYVEQGLNTLCYVMTMPNQRTINIYVNIYANPYNKGLLKPLRPVIGMEKYLAVLDCGRVPINNLDPVVRVVWLYNPTNVFTTWRLLAENKAKTADDVIKCLLYFAEVPAYGKLALPFAFMPPEMIDYEMTFQSSFGYETVEILVKGQGGLPNCMETRLDMPYYVEREAREAYRREVVYLSKEHVTIPMLPTHSQVREVLCICNDTDHVVRFIWFPENLANVLNLVMTPSWGVIQPKQAEWITMTVYSLQEPATFTTTVACEILDITERKRYQSNEMLRRAKIEKCFHEFVITNEGTFHPNINDSPPYVEDIEKPLPSYLSLSVSVCIKGQRDGCPRMLMKQIWEKVPPFDLLSPEFSRRSAADFTSSGNNMAMQDIIKIIDGVVWDALHSKMMRHQLEYYAKEEVPSYDDLKHTFTEPRKVGLSRRVSAGICDAIVNKAIYHCHRLNPKRKLALMDAD